MKLVKTASGKKTLKMSKSEWQNVGKKAGWNKKAQVEIDPDIEAKKYIQPIMAAIQNGQMSQAVLSYLAQWLNQADQNDAAANYKGQQAQPQQAQPVQPQQAQPQQVQPPQTASKKTKVTKLS